jgi:predicted MFS family arabinose efflux permease
MRLNNPSGIMEVDSLGSFFTAAAGAGIDYGTIFGGVVTEAEAGIATGMPLGVKIGGIILVAGIVWKVIKRFAK